MAPQVASTPRPQSLGTVLVTGGCGFLGHHIVNSLLAKRPSDPVHTLDLKCTRNRNTSPNAHYWECDLTNASAVTDVLQNVKPTVVIHTASPPGTGVPDEIQRKVNVDGTNVLLDACKSVGTVKAFVYTSSASVIYNPAHEIVNADEKWPVCHGKAQPEYYTTTKVYAEDAVLKSNRSASNPTMLTCSLRPAGIFGEGDTQMLHGLLQVYRQGQWKFQIGDNNNLFDCTYVGNVADAHILAAEALLLTGAMKTAPLDSEKVDGEAFFITNDEPTYFWDFFRAVWREIGPAAIDPHKTAWALDKDLMIQIGWVLERVLWAVGKQPTLTSQRAKYSSMTRYYCIDKAKKRLGYKPMVGLEEGIKRGVRDMLEHEKA